MLRHLLFWVLYRVDVECVSSAVCKVPPTAAHSHCTARRYVTSSGSINKYMVRFGGICAC
jgi:hypothetical protein